MKNMAVTTRRHGFAWVPRPKPIVGLPICKQQKHVFINRICRKNFCWLLKKLNQINIYLFLESVLVKIQYNRNLNIQDVIIFMLRKTTEIYNRWKIYVNTKVSHPELCISLTVSLFLLSNFHSSSCSFTNHSSLWFKHLAEVICCTNLLPQNPSRT